MLPLDHLGPLALGFWLFPRALILLLFPVTSSVRDYYYQNSNNITGTNPSNAAILRHVTFGLAQEQCIECFMQWVFVQF